MFVLFPLSRGIGLARYTDPMLGTPHKYKWQWSTWLANLGPSHGYNNVVRFQQPVSPRPIDSDSTYSPLYWTWDAYQG